MNVALLYKWAYNPQDALIEPDGSVSWRKAKYVASDDDATAVVYAREIAKETGGELIAATIGDGDATWALARGAAKAVSVEQFLTSPDDAHAAALLAYALKCVGSADVIIMADAQGYPGVAGALGASLSIPTLVGIRDVAIDPDNPHRLIAHRKIETGIQAFRITPPALIAISAERAETQAPGVKQLLAARKLPVERINVEADSVSDGSSVSIVAQRAPQARIAHRFEGDSAVADLVAQLRLDGVLE